MTMAQASPLFAQATDAQLLSQPIADVSSRLLKKAARLVLDTREAPTLAGRLTIDPLHH